MAKPAGNRPCWAVYLVRCADGTLYCGITTDIPRRLAQHNGDIPGGARYTAARRPVTLAAWAPCADRARALRLESTVRRHSREKKISFLDSVRHEAEEKGSAAGAAAFSF